MWRGVFLGTTAAGIACASACSSFDGDPPATDPGADAGVVEAAVDDQQTPPAPFCAGIDASLCESFDALEGGSAFFPDFADGSALKFDTVATSAPRAAHISQGNTLPAAIVKALATGLAEVTCAMQVRLEDDPNHRIVAFVGDNGMAYTLTAEMPVAPAVQLSLKVTPKLDDGGLLPPESVSIGSATIGSYIRLRLTYAADGGLSASIGNTSTPLTPSMAAAKVIAKKRPTSIRIGPEANEGTSAAMRVDDIICDWHE